MSPDPQHEPHEAPDVGTRRVVGLALGFVAFAILLGGGLSIYYRRITKGEKLAPAFVELPAPRLQPNPTQDWADLHAAQVNDLERYGWVDRAQGMVHVPIERAMSLVAARGPAAYDPVEGTPAFPPSGAAPLDGAPRATPQASVAPYGAVR